MSHRSPVGDAATGAGEAPDDRFLDDTRIRVHNMGTNAAGEMLFYPDPPAFFFESAFLDQETKDLTNGSFVFLFPRQVAGPNVLRWSSSGACAGRTNAAARRVAMVRALVMMNQWPPPAVSAPAGWSQVSTCPRSSTWRIGSG